MGSKKDKRLEAKKNKIKAFLDVAKLNEMDRLKANGAKSSTNQPESETDMPPSTAGETEGEKPKLTTDELKELRAKLREKQKATMQRPKVYITLPEWDDDEIKTKMVLSQDEKPLFVLDLQHLLLNGALNLLASWKPRWCKLLRPGKLQGSIVVIVDDASVEDYLVHPTSMPCLSSKFHMKVEMMSPTQYGRAVTQELFDVPVSFRKMNKGQYSKSHTKKKETVRIPVLMNERNDAFPRTDLLLNPEQMMDENYPLPRMGAKYEDYVFSKESYSHVTANSPLYAVDCEMCRTTVNPMELTRVSLVNEKLEVLYDELIKPANPITDYLTQYSGITKSMLAGVTTTLQDAQRALSRLLPKDAILCGQSLNNDLDALKMFHPYVIDTSLIFNLTGRRQEKTGLRRLTAEFLGRDIQTGTRGHNPVEDATATMELVLLKLQNSPGYGDVIVSGFMYAQAAADMDRAETTPQKNGDATSDTEPKMEPGTKIKMEPGTEPKTEPKTEPGTEPKTEPGTKIKTEPKTEPGSVNEVWEPHRNSCSQKRKNPSSSSSSSSEDEDQPSKRRKLDQNLIPIDQRKKLFFIQPGSRNYECFFRQCNQHKQTSVMIGRGEQVESFKARPVRCVTVTSDKQARKAAEKHSKEHFTTVLHLNGFSSALSQLTTAQEKQKLLSKIDGQIEKLLKKIGEKYLFCVLFTGRTTDVSTHHAMTAMKIT